jgi:phosphate transport system permease protein
VTDAARLRMRGVVNTVMLTLTGLSTVLICGLLFFVLGYLFIKGASTLDWAFFTKLPKPVGENGGGMANAIIGSAKMLAIATAIGVPIGFLGGVYLAEYGQKGFAFVVQYLTDLLNGVPSIVIGIFAYTVVVIPMHHFSTLAGGVALGVMMIPIAVRSTEEFLHAVPRGLREGALALGAPKWRMLATVVIPAAKQGIITGIMLDLARVAGETAPLLFTAFGNQFWSPGLDEPAASLPAMIFKYATSAYEDWHRQALAAGFVLLMLILTINVSARLILSRSRPSRAR